MPGLSVCKRALQRVQPAEMRIHQHRGAVREGTIRRGAFFGFLREESLVLVVNLLHVADVIRVKLVGGNRLQLLDPRAERTIPSYHVS